MFDTANLWIDMKESGFGDLVSELPHFVSGITDEGKNWNTGVTYLSGRVKNYKIRITDDGVSLKGSLAKFYFGNNFQTLTRKDTSNAIEEMSDLLHLPIKKAKVGRLDVGCNLKMVAKPRLYQTYLGDCQYYLRGILANTLYYQNDKRTLAVYNKVKEAKHKRTIIPKPFVGDNLLRYEVRFMKAVSRQFRTEVVGAKLYDCDFYLNAVGKWIREYEKINKIKTICFEMSGIETPKDFINQMAAMKMIEFGQGMTLIKVDELRAKEAFDRPESYSRLSTRIRQLCQNPAYTDDSEYTLELDKKVREAANYYKQLG